MTSSNYFKVLAVAVLAAMAAVLMVLGARPAEATFPGANGRIFFESSIVGGTIYALNPDGTKTEIAHGTEPAVSPDGTRVAYQDDSEIWVMNANGTGKRQLATAQRLNEVPAWSPDGTRIAYSAQPHGTDEWDIFVMNADGSGQRNLTNTQDELDEDHPAWSPDGQRIAYERSYCDPGQQGLGCVFVMNADGTQQTNLTTEKVQPECTNDPGSGHYGRSSKPSWSPDGTKIAFQGTASCGNNNTDIWVMNADGFGKTDLNKDDHNDVDPVFSPDGKQIAFASDREEPVWGTEEIYKIDLSTGTLSPRFPTDEAYNLDWQPVPQCTKTVAINNVPLVGTAGKDVLCGDNRDNTINGAGGNDIVLGGRGNDRLVGGGGNDTLNGGPGTDTGLYPGSTPVRASLTTGFATGFATGVGSDTLLAVENLTGSGANDRLTGSAAANALVGGKGADRLSGLGGADTLNSKDGARNDAVDGGPGKDKCLTDPKEVSITGCP